MIKNIKVLNSSKVQIPMLIKFIKYTILLITLLNKNNENTLEIVDNIKR